MKPLSLIDILFFLLNSFCLIGQVGHEVKIEGINAILNKNYIVGYEVILNKKTSIEFELGFDFFEQNIPVTLSNGSIEQNKFDQRRFNPAIGGKYYLLNNEKFGYGLYAGPYLQFDFLTHLEDEFAVKWKELNNRPAPFWAEKGLRTVYYGVQVGYKWLIKDHVIIEPTFFWLIEDEQTPNTISLNKSFIGDLFIKVGYRF